MEKCKLCNNPNLEKPKSHIISKFFYEWIKNTSPTGFIRDVANPNKRLQDGIKLEFLCSDCEKILGEWERDFSKNIFMPLCNSSNNFTFDCDDEYVLKFSVSIVWRALKYLCEINKISNMTEEEIEIIQSTLKIWEDYLLGNREDINQNKAYIIPIKTFMDNNDMKWQSYNRSIGIDFKVFDDQYWGFIFVKVPNMIIVGDVLGISDLKMKKYEVCTNNKIKDEAIPNMPELILRVINNCILGFEEGAENISTEQLKKINETFMKKNK